MGWENFDINIIEICPTKAQGLKENYYLQEYLPLLNSAFISRTTEHKIFATLTSILESKKPAGSLEKPYTRRQIWIYKFKDSTILPEGVEYANVSKARLATGAGPQTIKKYIDTNVPLRKRDQEVFYFILNL